MSDLIEREVTALEHLIGRLEGAAQDWHVDDAVYAMCAEAAAELARLTAEVERLSVDYDQAYSDGRSMLIHEFKMVCDQRDALLTKAALSGDASEYERGYESCRRFIGDFHGPVVRVLNDYIKENRQLTAEREHMEQIKKALAESGHPVCDDNGNLAILTLHELISRCDGLTLEVERLRADNARLRGAEWSCDRCMHDPACHAPKD